MSILARRIFLALSLFFLSVSVGLWAAPPGKSAADAKTQAAATAKEREVVTHHNVVIDGQTIPYTATAGTIILRDEKQEPTASIFYMAYTRDGVKDLSVRPITFVYNGGPGSSSVWLQLGGVGPRRVKTSDATFTPPPPYKLENNPYSILDKTDLVFLDPVGTGYSHALGKTKEESFWGVDADVESIGAFIEQYLGKFNRWTSPKFLLGESYGTTRSAALAYYLQEKGIACNGVMLVSSILNFQTAAFRPGNDLPSILYLPSYAAVAWYHHKLANAPKNLDALLAQVEAFATGEYAHALEEGDTLSPGEKEKLAEKLSAYTGISKAFWKEANLRVNNEEFEKELLHKEGKTTGRLDARFTGYSTELVLPVRTYPVMSEAISGAFTAVMNAYLRNNLKYKSRRDYKILNVEVERKWKWEHKIPNLIFESWPGFTNVAPDLRMAMVTNPHLQLMVNNGYFDLGTPFYATLYTLDHLELPGPLRDHVHVYNYFAGHMMYLHTPSLKKLHENMEHFIETAVQAR